MSDSIKVCWLAGSAFERKLALDKIKGQYSDAEVFTYDNDITLSYLEQQIFNGSCFSNFRIIILTALPESTSSRATFVKDFKKLLDTLPDDILLIINGIDPDDEKAISTHVIKMGRMVVSEKALKKDSAPPFVMSEFSKAGKVILEADAEKLVELNGYDPELKAYGVDVLRLAILKICSYLGRRKNVTTEDIVLNSFPSEEFVIWTVFEAMDSKNIEHCIKVLQQLYQDVGDEVQALEKLYAMALSRYNLLFFLKETLATKCSQSKAMQEASALLKLKQSGIGANTVMNIDIIETGENKGEPSKRFADFTIKQAIQGGWGKPPVLELYSRKELRSIVQCLEDGLGELRSRTSVSNKIIMGDVLMFTVCNTMDDKLLSKVRIWNQN